MVTLPSCFLPSSQTASLSEAAFCPTAESHPVGQHLAQFHRCTLCQHPSQIQKSQSQNTNALSLPILLMVLLCDLQGGSDCTAPSLNLTELALSILFWSYMHLYWLHNNHDFVWNHRVRDRIAWEKAGRVNLEPNRIPNVIQSLGRSNPRALSHFNEACSTLRTLCHMVSCQLLGLPRSKPVRGPLLP